MKMLVSEEMCKWLLERQKRQSDYAKSAACDYARTDNPVSKARYNECCAIEKEIAEVYSAVCQCLHALESKIPGSGDKEVKQ